MSKKAIEEAPVKSKRAHRQDFNRKIAGLVIGLIGIFLLVFVVFFTVSRVFRPLDFAVMLPKDSTIALMQININPGHEQVSRFYNTLNRYEVYNPLSIQNLLNETLDINFDSDIKPWVNRQAGFAMIEKQDAQGEFDLAVFIEAKDKGETKKFMESRGLKSQEDYLLSNNYSGTDIYRYALGQTFNFIFLNNYLIIGNNEDVLKIIIDSSKSPSKQLISNPEYQKVSQNLPITNLVFTFIDSAKLINLLKSNNDFMGVKGQELLAFEPFLKIYKSLGFTLLMENEHLVIQTYTMLDNNYLEGRDLLSFDTKFRARFLDYIPQDIKFYAGGLNLEQQFHRYAEIFNSGGDVSYLIFEGTVKSLKNQYFGEQIDLEEDIYPLLQSEYLIAVNGEGDNQATTLIFGLKDPLKDKDKIQKIAEAFINKTAIIEPKVVEVTLEDGTVSKEIINSQAEISKSQEEYRGYIINIMNIGGQNWGVYYLVLDDKLVVTTKIDALKKSTDLFIDPADSFTSSVIQRDSIQPVLRTSDEVMFMDFEFITSGLMNADLDWLKQYLAPFKYLSVGKNYFKDGISTINYITIQ